MLAEAEKYYNEYLRYLNSDMPSFEYDKYLEEKDINRAKMIRMAKIYAIEVLNMTQEEWELKLKECNEGKKDWLVYLSKIEKMTELSKIILLV